MKHFKLPDLGEGLQEAEIVEWHVKAGDSVRADQRLVSVETAKALVDIPAPYDGVVGKLFGAEGDILHVGEPLVGFEGEEADAGTVVGRLEGGGSALEDRFFIGAAPSTREHLAPRATPAVRQFARQQGVELAGLSGSGPDGLITRADVEAAAQGARERFGGERLRGVRRSMALNMARSHAEVVPVVIIGVASYLFFAPLGLGNSYLSLIVVHAVLGVPFVIITVSATLQGFNYNLVRAAASLGAPPLTTFFRVTLPLIAPGVISGALFAFATSFDEVVVTLFLAGPEQATLPRQMFSGIRENLSPTIAAAATLLIGFSVLLLLTLEWLRGRSEKMRTAQPGA
ncbi:biotin/lipoyl-containing protein [Pseudomonas aeruginosa]